MEKREQKTVKEAMSILAKRSHKKNPRPKEFYQEMAKKRWEKVKKESV